jgi:hypothetical protein
VQINNTHPLQPIKHNNKPTLTFKEFLMSSRTSFIVFTLDSEFKPIYLNYSLTLKSSSYTTITNLLYSVFAIKRQRIKDAFNTKNKGAKNYSVLRIVTGPKKALKRVKKAI